MSTARDVAFQSGEHRLAGTLYRPTEQPAAVAVLNGATGVPASYYGEFARWLADEKGVACLTFDYRDFGASAKQHPRNSRSKMSDWGVHDQQAARDFVTAQFPDAPLWVIGHSLGGLCLPFQKNLDRISRVIVVGSGPVHVRDHPWPYQALARLFWFGHAPLATILSGFLPGRVLSLGPDLPSGVYWQWRRWCTRKDFFTRDIGTILPYPDWDGIKASMKVVAMADDDVVPPFAVWRLMQFYPEARKTQTVLRPADFGLAKLGHIGVFASKSRAAWSSMMA